MAWEVWTIFLDFHANFSDAISKSLLNSQGHLKPKCLSQAQLVRAFTYSDATGMIRSIFYACGALDACVNTHFSGHT